MEKVALLVVLLLRQIRRGKKAVRTKLCPANPSEEEEWN